MTNIVGNVKSFEVGTFFAKGIDGQVRQLKIGDLIYDGEKVYGAVTNGANAKIVIDVLLAGAGDLVISGNGALTFDTSVLAGIFTHHDAVVYVNSVQEALAVAEAKSESTIVKADVDADVTDAGETAAGESVTDTERAGDIFAARTGAVGDVSTGLLDPIGGISGATVTDTQPIILQTPTIQVGNPVTGVGDIIVNEGEDAIFGIFVTNVAAGGSLILTLEDGTALNPDDYPNTIFQYSIDGGTTWTDYTGAAIPLNSGDSTLQVKVGTYDDVLNEDDETFVLGATLNSNGADYSDIATATIVDDNDTYSLQIFAVSEGEEGPVYSAANSMDEEGTATYVVLAVDGNGDPLGTQPDGTVTVNVGDVSATRGDDYTSNATYLATIGETFTIDAKDDALAESDEQFTLSLEDGSWSNDATYENVVYQGTVTTTITDNDIITVADAVSDDDDVLLNTDTNPNNNITHAGTIESLSALNTVSVSFDSTGLTSQGKSLTWSWDDVSKTLTASTSSTTVFTLVVNADNSGYVFTQLAAIDHLDTVQGEDDTKTLNFTLSVIGLGSTEFSVTVSDDMSEIGNPQDLIMTNRIGNSTDGVSLDISNGADRPISIILTPEVNQNGFAVDKLGNLLTSTVNGITYNLVYITASDGSVTAYQADPVTDESNGISIFTLTPDLLTGTYSGTYSGGIDGLLDGYVQEVNVNYGTGGISGGNDTVLAYLAGDSTPNISTDNLYIVASTTIGETVNYNASNGMGVSDKGTIDKTESLLLNFTDYQVIVIDGNKDVVINDAKTQAINNPLSLSEATFELTRFTVGDTAIWKVYSGGLLVGEGTQSATGTGKNDQAFVTLSSLVVYDTMSVVGNSLEGNWTHVDGVISFDALGSFTGDSTATVTYYLAGDPIVHTANITLSDGESLDMGVFDSVSFTASSGDFSVYSMTGDISTETSGLDHTISVGVSVTDYDGDIITDTFDVTFDADGTILYADNTVISGGSGIDTLILSGDDGIDFGLLDSTNNPITNIEAIDLSVNGDHQLQNISHYDILDITGGGKTLTILGDAAADAVSVDDATMNYTGASTEIFNGTSYDFNIYTSSIDPTVTLRIENTITDSLIP